MLGCLQEKFKSLILFVFGLLFWRTIIGSWQESEEPLKVLQPFTREEPLMVLQHVSSPLKNLWRFFTSEEVRRGRAEEPLKVLHELRDEEP